ncbi:L,D-transpeptidase family protein [Paenirhodobacter sp.]|uniref:L,D-transpeptidase family protein n=1 Tax=Paenirhodobacter sp. TaxID=1965326 RepID=UPI003B3CBDC1
MQRRTLLMGLSGLTLLASCGGDSAKFLPYTGPKITQIQIYKAERKMYLISIDKVVKEYKIALGGNPVGKKRFEGDGKTPEGLYFIDRQNPRSAYHLSIGISYPNPQDRAYAESQGRKPGGDIFIHGRAGKDKGRGKDWTAGCIAVTDREIEDIYKMVSVGTPVWIFP